MLIYLGVRSNASAAVSEAAKETAPKARASA